jgi:hypothetical protein
MVAANKETTKPSSFEGVTVVTMAKLTITEFLWISVSEGGSMS